MRAWIASLTGMTDSSTSGCPYPTVPTSSSMYRLGGPVGKASRMLMASPWKPSTLRYCSESQRRANTQSRHFCGSFGSRNGKSSCQQPGAIGTSASMCADACGRCSSLRTRRVEAVGDDANARKVADQSRSIAGWSSMIARRSSLAYIGRLSLPASGLASSSETTPARVIAARRP
jgi:hypothetical protein